MAPLLIRNIRRENKLKSCACSLESNTDVIEELTIELGPEDIMKFEKTPDGCIIIQCVFEEGYQLVFEKELHLDFKKNCQLNQTFVQSGATSKLTTSEDDIVFRVEEHNSTSPSSSTEEVQNKNKAVTDINIKSSGGTTDIDNNIFGHNITQIVQESKSSGPIHYGFPQSVEKLFGREKEIKEISEKLKSGVTVTITGTALLGKTTLAAEFARRWTLEEDKADRAMLDATDEQTISQSVRGLAQIWNMKVHDLNTTDILNMIFSHYLEGKRTILLIFDNMDESTDKKRVVLNDKKSVHLLATTQNKEMGQPSNCVALDSLSEQDSEQLLKHKISDEDFSEIEKKTCRD